MIITSRFTEEMASSEIAELSGENGYFIAPEEETTSWSTRFRRWIGDNLFLVANVVGILLGFLVGILCRYANLSESSIMWLGMPGELYMRILKCIIIPLIVCSVIDGTANTDPKTNGKLGLVSLAYIVLFNSIGAMLGLVMVALFRPGAALRDEVAEGSVDTRHLSTVDIVADFIRNVFPPNMIGAALEVSQTQYNTKEEVQVVNISGQLINQTTLVMEKSLGTVSSTNILGLIVISAALGVAASQAGEQAKPFLAVFKSGAHIIFKLFTWIKWTTPVGSASLITTSLVKLDNLGPAFRTMGFFTLQVTVANIVIIQLFIFSLTFFLVRRLNPLRLFTQSARAWLVAFGSISSTIPYPEYILALKKFRVDARLTEYVLPLCLTLNRCGSAIFITSTCVFITQIKATAEDSGSLFTIGVLGILSSLAIPSVNSASVVSIVIILESLGVSTTGAVGLVIAMEWFNDRIRSTTNAMSHIVCVLTTWRLCRKNFSPVLDVQPDEVVSKL